MIEELNKIYEKMITRDFDSEELPNTLYHGTTESAYYSMKNNKWNVTNLYVTDNKENAIEYAYQKQQDDTAVLFELETFKLDGVFKLDVHDEDTQVGQWIFDGNIDESIIKIYRV